MPGFSAEKCRSCTLLLRASYSLLANVRMVSCGNMGIRLGGALELRLLEFRVQVVVFEGAALAELVQLERERQAPGVKLIREMQLHDVEQPAARRAFRRIVAAGADFQDGVHETRIALAPVGDAKLLAGNRPYPYAAGRK